MRMETLSTAMNRLRSQGYIEDFIAAPDGELHCGACEGDCATNVEVDEIVRFEGASDPGDSVILVALHCGCGHAGLFSASYGPDIAPNDAMALRRLAERRTSSDD